MGCTSSSGGSAVQPTSGGRPQGSKTKEAWKMPKIPEALMNELDAEQLQNITKSRNEALAPIEEAFRKMDANGNGEIDFEEALAYNESG